MESKSVNSYKKCDQSSKTVVFRLFYTAP